MVAFSMSLRVRAQLVYANEAARTAVREMSQSLSHNWASFTPHYDINHPPLPD